MSSASTSRPESGPLGPALAPLLDDLDAAATAPARDGEIQSAVLVPILPRGGDDPHIVLTRRNAGLRRHAGEVSFPGGRRERDDATLIDTALRESEEEIGLRRDVVELAGALPATSTFVTKYAIHPFVGLIEAAASWTPSPLEVDAVLELPLHELARSRTSVKLTRRGFTFETDAYLIADEMIWGATARILDELLRRAKPLLGVTRRNAT